MSRWPISVGPRQERQCKKRWRKWLHNSAGRPAETENRSASLGLVGAAGLVALVAVVLLPVPRPWPYGPLAGMTVFVLLYATIGGFGSVFNLLVSPQIRALNRISVFVAFFCFLAVLWFLDRDKQSSAERDRRGEVLFIDARHLGQKISRTQIEFTEDEVKRIANTYRSWRGPTPSTR